MARGSVNAALQEPASATFMSCTQLALVFWFLPQNYPLPAKGDLLTSASLAAPVSNTGFVPESRRLPGRDA